MTKISFTVCGDANREVLDQALYGATAISYPALALDTTNELVYDTSYDSMNYSVSAEEIKRRIIRRVRWFARRSEDFAFNPGISKQTRKKQEALALKCFCIADVIEGKMSKEDLEETHGDLYAEVIKEKKNDPLLTSAIELIQQQMNEVSHEYSVKVTDYTNKMYAERDKKLEALQKELRDLKSKSC